MKKDRMIEILLLAAENHKRNNGVCNTLSTFVNIEEFNYVTNFLYENFRASENPFWLSPTRNTIERGLECARSIEGTEQRINILLDAAMYVEVFEVPYIQQ